MCNSTLSYYVNKHLGSSLSLQNSLINYNASHPKVNIHFFHTVLDIFPMDLTRRIWIPKLWKKEKICIQRLTKELVFPWWWSKPRLWLVDLSYNFECDWFMKIKILNVIFLLNCPITNCPITTWASELTENVSFSNHSQSRKL